MISIYILAGSLNLLLAVIDNYLQTFTPISLAEVPNVSFAINKDAASANPGRSSVVLSTVASPIDIVGFNNKKTITCYPNPISGKNINLQMFNQPQGTYTVELVNSLGQLVQKVRINHGGGTAVQSIQLNNTMATGLYQLRIKQKDETTTLKIVAN